MRKILILITALVINVSFAQNNLEQIWQNPPDDARAWTFWYWMQGAISRQGITADLEAMKEIGLGGAYLMSIKDVPEKPFIENSVRQLSPLWWEMLRFAFEEADRLGLEIGFHVCDGFALAGGPWITPELSMQKIVWTKTPVKGGKILNVKLPQPESYENYYRDIAVYAYPTLDGTGISTDNVIPKITTSVTDVDAQFLADINTKQSFGSVEPCWIQYEFENPFTLRTLQIQPSGRNFQSQRFTIEYSNDGINFQKITQLESPRQGWQNDDFAMTHAVKPTTARYFRFLYDLKGTEPGYEDMDVAKWKQSLKIRYIRLSSEQKIHQYEGKNGSVWRVSKHTNEEQIPLKDCIDTTKLLNISQFVGKNGTLNWKAPKGDWTIIRIGHTSTGHTNATGGGGKGLECDKFNPEAVRLQFNSWFGKTYNMLGEDLAKRVLKVFHVDSWECGSQNWSPLFRDEFKKRRGYDIVDYLPVMAGIAVQSPEFSEKILFDVRLTISELAVDVFYKILCDEAHKKGCRVSAESIAPTMVSDGLLHHKFVDLPMGEFWLQSPTHDKPNDVLDAVSGAHIYGKNIVQAEAFTQIRGTFTEYPEMLKTLQDRNYAQGINKLAFHVNVLNPWLDRKPGMTLDGIGLYFQRDQTWWNDAPAWMDYTARCQALLQWGKPVADLAVFIGDEVPRRSILPDRLVPFMPGIFGNERVENEKIRLANEGTPTAQVSVGVTFSKNTYVSENWLNPLRGYAYDCVNPDVLKEARVENGDLILKSGARYRALLVPDAHPMQPNPEAISAQTKSILERLKRENLRQIETPYLNEDFSKIGFERDFIVLENNIYAEEIVYNHRTDDKSDIYFISNQKDIKRKVEISLRVKNKIPEIWNPVNGKIHEAEEWKFENGRTILPLILDAGESLFVVLRTETTNSASQGKNWTEYNDIAEISNLWKVNFDTKKIEKRQEVTMDSLVLWNHFTEDNVRFFSGTASYVSTFNFNKKDTKNIYIELEEIYNIATVKINGKNCGTIWTKPYRVDISDALKQGKNTIEITVTNTWANRIMGDEIYNTDDNSTDKVWTNARYRTPLKQPVNSGLAGKVKVVEKLK